MRKIDISWTHQNKVVMDKEISIPSINTNKLVKLAVVGAVASVTTQECMVEIADRFSILFSPEILDFVNRYGMEGVEILEKVVNLRR